MASTLDRSRQHAGGTSTLAHDPRRHANRMNAALQQHQDTSRPAQGNRHDGDPQKRQQVQRDHELAVNLTVGMMDGAPGPSTAVTRSARFDDNRSHKTTPHRPQRPREASVATRQIHRPPHPPVTRARGATPPPVVRGDLECTVCGDDTTANDSIVPGCSHRMCRTCVAEIFRNALKDRRRFPPRCCPIKDKGQITLASVRHLLPGDLARTFEKKAIEFATINGTYCYKPRCSTFIPANNIKASGKVGVCPECNSKTCTQCKHPSHPGEPCADDPGQEKFERLADKEGWKPCPRCTVMVEKTHGCNHVSCMCGYEYCFRCTRRYRTCDCDVMHWEDMFPPGNMAWAMPRGARQDFFQGFWGQQQPQRPRRNNGHHDLAPVRPPNRFPGVERGAQHHNIMGGFPGMGDGAPHHNIIMGDGAEALARMPGAHHNIAVGGDLGAAVLTPRPFDFGNAFFTQDLNGFPTIIPGAPPDRRARHPRYRWEDVGRGQYQMITGRGYPRRRRAGPGFGFMLY